MTLECSEALATPAGGERRRGRHRKAGSEVTMAQALLRDIMATVAASNGVEIETTAAANPRASFTNAHRRGELLEKPSSGDSDIGEVAGKDTISLHLAKEWLDEQLEQMATHTGRGKSKGNFVSRVDANFH